MKEDESMPEMFYRLQVLVNDLKALGETHRKIQVTDSLSTTLMLTITTLIQSTKHHTGNR
jgi:hypothetical protein